MKYKYLNYTITNDGTFIAPNGHNLKWIDDKFVKLKFDEKYSLRNGLNILYELYNGKELKKGFIIQYKDPNSNAKTKDNLIAVPRCVALNTKNQKKFTEEEVKEIRNLYGLTEEERKVIKTNKNHPSMSYRQLAKKYDTSVTMIERIIQGTYKCQKSEKS